MAEQRKGTEAIPVCKPVNLPPLAHQRHHSARLSITGHRDQGNEIAAFGKIAPPFDPVKRRASLRRAQQFRQYGIALHFLKIIVILNGDQPPDPLDWSLTKAVRAETFNPIRPLDHLALRGADEAPALILREAVLSYKDLRMRVASLAGWLKGQVSQDGARVTSWAAKGELTCLLPLAAARAGLVHVPINPLLKRAQVAHILNDSGAELLLGTPARLASLEPGDVPDFCKVLPEAAALEGGAQLPPSSANPDELAAILYTSGSTGRPKGVMLSHANMWLGAESVATYLGLSSDDRALAVLPLSFDYGQNQLLSSWYAGASVVPLDYLTPRDVVKAVERHGVTTLAAVPPLWVQLTELEWPSETAAKLRLLTNSGGALTADLVRRLRKQFPQARLFPMYGLTEAFRSTYLDPALVDTHPTSMGMAIPHAEVFVISDNGALAKDYEEGELVHCGPLVAQGYWQDSGRTAERFKPAPAMSHYGGMAVWSGDRVKRGADGLLYFAGRRDAMIKSAGNRISPQEIEDAALATGLVSEAVALGIPDLRLGQAVHLIVRRAPNHSDSAEDLSRILMQELPNFMQPKQIHWRETMPVGPNGKIDRTRLYAELAA
jgi:acyl-CoA ligase (AMP-forming) (exosortase A-associated)